MVSLQTNTHSIYDCARSASDFFKKPLYEWRPYQKSDRFQVVKILMVAVMALGFVASLAFRQIAIWASPGKNLFSKNNFVTTTTGAQVKKVADEVSLLSFNILGMPGFKSDMEGRPSIQERMTDVFDVIKRANADIVLLQEVHAGSSLENKIIEEFKDDYGVIHHDMGQSVLTLGSGLMVMTKFAHVDFEFHAFDDCSLMGSRRGFGVLTIKDEKDQVVMRVANTHLEAGGFSDGESPQRRIRRSQAKQILDFAQSHKDSPFVFAGDLNIDRRRTEYADLSHPVRQFADGFGDDDKGRRQPTNHAIGIKESGHPNQALDYVLGTNLGEWKLNKPEYLSDFEPVDAPSDHASVKVSITRSSL